MKKKILSGVFALALLATAGFGVKKSMMSSDAGLSDLALANVEALAQENGGGAVITCSRSCVGGGRCWKSTYIPEYGQSYCTFSGHQEDYCIC